MATLQDAITAISTKIASQLSATRMASDYLADREGFTAGQTKFQLRKVATTLEGGSNQDLSVLAMNVVVHHKLSDPDDEQAYGDDGLLTNLSALLATDFWETILEVHDFAEDGIPASELGDVVRVGDIVSFTISVAIQVQP